MDSSLQTPRKFDRATVWRRHETMQYRGRERVMGEKRSGLSICIPLKEQHPQGSQERSRNLLGHIEVD